MDFNWISYFGGFWILPPLCMVFMIVMMVARGSMFCRLGDRSRNRKGHVDDGAELLPPSRGRVPRGS